MSDKKTKIIQEIKDLFKTTDSTSGTESSELPFPIDPQKHAGLIYSGLILSFLIEILILWYPAYAALGLIFLGLNAEYLLQLRLFAATILMVFFITKSDLWSLITHSYSDSRIKFFIGLGLFLGALLSIIQPDLKIILNNIIPIAAGLIALFNLLIDTNVSGTNQNKSADISRQLATRSLVLLVAPGIVARFLILITIIEIGLLGQPLISLNGCYLILGLTGFFWFKPS